MREDDGEQSRLGASTDRSKFDDEEDLLTDVMDGSVSDPEDERESDSPGETENEFDEPIDDPLFEGLESGPTIFRDKRMLTIRHIPGEERIVGRDEQIDRVVNEVGPVVRRDPPNNVIIYGKTGTGKSLVSRYVLERTERVASSRGINFGYAYVDCSTDDSETQALITISDSLNNERETDISIPYNGLGTSNYYRKLWDILDQMYDSVILILDEVDVLPSDDILMTLSRAQESGKTTCDVGIIAISNKLEFKDRLTERVISSLSEEELFFPAYDADQLQEILENRRDAFADGVLKEDAIPLCSALAAQEHGDARKAIDILRNAGEIAEENEDPHVGEQHVREARKKAEIDRFKESIRGSTQQTKSVLYALASLTESGAKDAFTTTEVHERYKKVCKAIDGDAVTHQRVYDLLKEQRFLGVVKITKTSRGRGEGVTLEHELRKSHDVVKKAILEDSRFSQLE